MISVLALIGSYFTPCKIYFSIIVIRINESSENIQHPNYRISVGFCRKFYSCRVNKSRVCIPHTGGCMSKETEQSCNQRASLGLREPLKSAQRLYGWSRWEKAWVETTLTTSVCMTSLLQDIQPPFCCSMS